MEISLSEQFIRVLESLPDRLHDEVLDKIELFSDIANHKALKVHKLSGRLAGFYAFSVNYHIRIVFEYLDKPRRAFLLNVGDHDVYDK